MTPNILLTHSLQIPNEKFLLHLDYPIILVKVLVGKVTITSIECVWDEESTEEQRLKAFYACENYFKTLK